MIDRFGEEIKVGDVCMVVTKLGLPRRIKHAFEKYSICVCEDNKTGHFSQNFHQYVSLEELVRIGRL